MDFGVIHGEPICGASHLNLCIEREATHFPQIRTTGREMTGFKRIGGSLVAIGAAMAFILIPGTAAQARSMATCKATDADTTYCEIKTYGNSGAGYGNKSGQTGVTHLWIDWNSKGSVSGSICVTDTWGNGRGVKVRLQGHRAGTYGDNGYVSLGTFKDTGRNCSFSRYSGFHRAGITDIKVTYADTWISCDFCTKGTLTVPNPRYYGSS
ncbi:hypothetical protein [Streptosporangium sp. NPDC001681]|uniref:hypothetical protein n=1 Tax=Streptosporangium sp. NPDC001681 TaxID=3154395 RepID=UPI00331B6FC0